MSNEYCPEKQLIKDFIHYISDNHKCCVVCFPDEFAAHAYVNYKFVNVTELLDGFIKERKV